MLRQAASRLSGSLGGLVRSIGTTAARLEGEAAPAGVKEFSEAWAKTAPSTLALPELPTNFLAPETSGEAAVDGERFAVNLFTPHGMVAQSKVRGSAPDHFLCSSAHGLLRCAVYTSVVSPQRHLHSSVSLGERGRECLVPSQQTCTVSVLPQDIPRPLSPEHLGGANTMPVGSRCVPHHICMHWGPTQA